MRRVRSVLVACLAVLVCLPALAVEPDEVLQNPVLEHRARVISEGLRCLVCQNQSIDQSEAPLAKDLRLLVRERLKAGDSDQQVRDYIVRRYGEFVLLRPMLNEHTALLWFAPLIVLAAGAAGIYASVRRRNRRTVAALDARERAALDALLQRDRSARP